MQRTSENYQVNDYLIKILNDKKDLSETQSKNQLFLMDLKNIEYKCIIYEKSDNLFYVTEYFNENEHD